MLKHRVNQLLGAATGYQLHRTDGEPSPQSQSRSSRRTGEPREAGPPRGGGTGKKGRGGTGKEQPLAHGEPRGATEPPQVPGRKRRALPSHYDGAAKEIIERVRPRTMTGPEKLFGLILATRYIVAHGIPGDFVECGVWRGGSMQAAALALSTAGDTSRNLHLFDTYEGMPPPSEKDRRHDGATAQALLETQDRTRPVWAVATLDDVQAGMAEIDYPAERIHFHVGRVETTIPAEAPEQIAMLRLDTDWYESTRHELRELYDRLSPGGVLIIDDYGHWEGARQAVEEFLAETGPPLLLLPLASGRIAVKPGLVAARRGPESPESLQGRPA